MNKYLLVSFTLIFSVLFSGCAHTIDSSDYALGEVNSQQLLLEYESFSTSYQEFEVKEEQNEQVKQWPSNLKIDVYFATWCPDSQREVPRLLKALEANSQIEVMLLALDFKKSEPEGRAKLADIKYTPTFVVSLAGKEIGRIIERPEESLVDDISAMFNQK